MPGIDSHQITTIERFIMTEQLSHPGATGVLTNLLYDLALAGKIIASKTTRAGLAEILGRTEEINIQGEEVQKLDRFADFTIIRVNDHTGRLAVMASEEHADPIPIPDKYPKGKYVLLFDPLDGSSNIDFNIPVGTIFAIFRRKSDTNGGTLDDCLQPGRNLVGAGYIIFGSSTMMVYSTGQGTHGFTLDPSVGEFLLSHPYIKLPDDSAYFSANVGNQKYWSKGIQKFTNFLQGQERDGKSHSLRYVGSLVADFHRNLLSGGIFYYPTDSMDSAKPEGKLRLLYEAIPLAFLVEQAGGYASNGVQDILEIQPESLHQRSPLFIGNRNLVLKAEEYIQKFG